MAPQPIIPEGVNAIGITAFVASFFCCIGAFIAAGSLFRHLDIKNELNWPQRTGWIGAAMSALHLLRHGGGEVYDRGLWTDPEKRKRFLPFFGCCALGVLCVFIALMFGGWPTGPE